MNTKTPSPPKSKGVEEIMKEFDEKWGWYLQGIITERATDYKTEIQDFLLKKIRAIRKDTLEAVERGMSLNFGKDNFMDKEANKVDCRNCYIKAFNDYHRKLLSLISGMKGGKE